MRLKMIVLPLLLLAAGMIYWLWPKESEVLTPVWDQDRHIRYGFLIKNNSAQVKRNVEFKAFAPMALTATQKVIDISSTHPYELAKDEFGQQVMTFNLAHLPPYASEKINITVALKLSSVAAQAYQASELYLSPQPLIELADENIQALSEHLLEGDVSQAQSIYDWLQNNMEYTGYGMADKGAAFAVNQLAGDCTEYAYLATALARLMNVPARAVNGYVVSQDSKLNVADFHTWSELWFDGGWQVLDAQKGFFQDRQSEFIAMSVYDQKLNDNNKEHFNQFAISDTDLFVKMQ